MSIRTARCRGETAGFVLRVLLPAKLASSPAFAEDMSWRDSIIGTGISEKHQVEEARPSPVDHS